MINEEQGNKMNTKDLPQVTQAPIIEFSKLEKIKDLVEAEIKALDIDNIEVTEEKLSLLKNTRASLNNRFKEFEDRRKLIKAEVAKPYIEFEAQYKALIATPFTDNEAKLKTNIQSIESGILEKKVNAIKDYFLEKNTFDFIKFEDLGLKINRSASDKSIQNEIDVQLEKIKSDLSTIETLENKDRILACYQINKDLNASISSVNIELEREKSIIEAKERARQAEAERVQRMAEAQQAEAQQKAEQPAEEIKAEEQPKEDENKVYKASFTIRATKLQIRDLKTFMEEKGIKYE